MLLLPSTQFKPWCVGVVVLYPACLSGTSGGSPPLCLSHALALDTFGDVRLLREAAHRVRYYLAPRFLETLFTLASMLIAVAVPTVTV